MLKLCLSTSKEVAELTTHTADYQVGCEGYEHRSLSWDRYMIELLHALRAMFSKSDK